MRIQVCITTYNRPESLCDAIKSVIRQGIFDIDIIIRLNTREGSTVRVGNYFKSGFDYDLQVGLCDDMEMLDGCLLNGIKCFSDNFPDLDGVVGFNQVNVPNGCPNAIGIVGRKFAERFPGRNIYCPDYHHFGVDAECMAYAESVGKFKFCEEAKIYHYHPACSCRKPDDTHKSLRVLASNDHSIQEERKKRGLVWGKSFERVTG